MNGKSRKILAFDIGGTKIAHALVDENGRLLTERIDSGEWETIIDHTNQRYGFWGISYLEALLRAADITCSKEGL